MDLTIAQELLNQEFADEQSEQWCISWCADNTFSVDASRILWVAGRSHAQSELQSLLNAPNFVSSDEAIVEALKRAFTRGVCRKLLEPYFTAEQHEKWCKKWCTEKTETLPTIVADGLWNGGVEFAQEQLLKFVEHNNARAASAFVSTTTIWDTHREGAFRKLFAMEFDKSNHGRKLSVLGELAKVTDIHFEGEDLWQEGVARVLEEIPQVSKKYDKQTAISWKRIMWGIFNKQIGSLVNVAKLGAGSVHESVVRFKKSVSAASAFLAGLRLGAIPSDEEVWVAIKVLNLIRQESKDLSSDLTQVIQDRVKRCNVPCESSNVETIVNLISQELLGHQRIEWPEWFEKWLKVTASVQTIGIILSSRGHANLESGDIPDQEPTLLDKILSEIERYPVTAHDVRPGLVVLLLKEYWRLPNGKNRELFTIASDYNSGLLSDVVWAGVLAHVGSTAFERWIHVLPESANDVKQILGEDCTAKRLNRFVDKWQEFCQP